MTMLTAVAASMGSTLGDTYTVNAGETQTYDSITNTARFTKNGAGELARAPMKSCSSVVQVAFIAKVLGEIQRCARPERADHFRLACRARGMV